MKAYYFSDSLSSNLLDCLTSIGEASHKQEKLNKVKEEIITAENRLEAIIEEKMETDSEKDDERLSNEYKETKKHLNELKAKLHTLSGETYQSFISEARSKKIASLIINMDNDECYLKLINEVIVNEDNSITIIDNAGHRISKENISKNIKKINGLEEVLHCYYTSPITTKVYKYKIVRLEDYPWLKK